MINLNNLRRRVFGVIPEEYQGEVGREIEKFQYEIDKMSEERSKTGQASLADKEISKLKTTNQHGEEGLTVIQYQSIKAKAMENGVEDWTNKIDSELSYRENMALMEIDKNGY